MTKYITLIMPNHTGVFDSFDELAGYFYEHKLPEYIISDTYSEAADIIFGHYKPDDLFKFRILSIYDISVNRHFRKNTQDRSNSVHYI